jgi:hypothetical protein
MTQHGIQEKSMVLVNCGKKIKQMKIKLDLGHRLRTTGRALKRIA